MTNNFFRLMLITALTLFISCSPDEQSFVNEPANGITFKTVSFDEFKTNKSAFNELQKALLSSTMGKMVNDTVNGFYYDDEQVIIAEYDDIKTYTFRIYRTTPKNNSIENLVLRETTDGIKPYIFTYSLTENDIINIEQNIRVADLPQKTIMSTLAGDPTGIYRINGKCYILKTYDEDEQHDGVSYYYHEIECPDKEEPTNPTLTNPGNPTSGGGGAAPINIIILQPTVPGMEPYDPGHPLPGGAYDGPMVVTTPVVNLMLQRFINDLTANDPTGNRLLYLNLHKTFKSKIIAFLESDGSNYEQNADIANDLLNLAMDGNEEAANQILDYLDEEDNSEESILFVEEAMQALENDGEVDFEDNIIYDSTFTNSQSECIHKKMQSNSISLYSNMINHFGNFTDRNLTFKIGSTGTDWGITKGDSQNPYNYTITVNNTVENGTNLMKYITLSHELVHAYMFSELEKLGLITFDSGGNPIANVNCPNSGVNLNTLTVKDRFTTLICAMNQAGTLTPEWSHDIFNTTVFGVLSYRQKLESFLLYEYDWVNENSNFTTEASTVFGASWKLEVSRAISWLGLENTQEYSTYINSYASSPAKVLFITDISSKISNTNNNCP